MLVRWIAALVAFVVVVAAGIVIAGGIPEAGEGFDHEGWRVEVVELDGHRVATVRLRRAESPRERS